MAFLKWNLLFSLINGRLMCISSETSNALVKKCNRCHQGNDFDKPVQRR